VDLGHANSPPPAEEGPLTGTMHVYRNHHLSEPGAGARRPLGAALSIGTLQLSIRCSSIRFFPSCSLPVSTSGRLEGWIAAFGVRGSPAGALSRADAGKIRKSARAMVCMDAAWSEQKALDRTISRLSFPGTELAAHGSVSRLCWISRGSTPFQRRKPRRSR